MILFRTPNARPWRVGGWASPLFAVALLLVFLLVLPLFSPARSDKLREQLAQKQSALEQANAELNALQDELNRLAEAHNTAEVRLAELQTEINDLEDDIA
jgi:septal ring factor EnvC (AmiA/AmiB activator)